MSVHFYPRFDILYPKQTLPKVNGAQNIWKSAKPNVALSSFWGLILLGSSRVKDKFQNSDFWDVLSVHFYPRINILYPKQTLLKVYGVQNLSKSVKPNVELNSFWGLILLVSRRVKDKFQNFDFWEALSVHFYPRIDILYPKQTLLKVYGAQNIWKSVKPNVELNSFWGLILLLPRGVKDKF